MSGVPCRVTILTPGGSTQLPRQPSAVSERALRVAGSLRTLSVLLGDEEIPPELADTATAGDCELVVTYYLADDETLTYSGTVDAVESRGSHVLVTFRTDG